MLTIRLSRKGKKKYPIYHLIVSEKTRDPWGRFLEDLGNFNPHDNTYKFNKDRILHWIKCGAQTSVTVHNLLVSKEIIKANKIKVGGGKKKKAEAKAAQ